jgi:glutamine cyclotransferase
VPGKQAVKANRVGTAEVCSSGDHALNTLSMNSIKFIAFSNLLLFFLACGGERDPQKLFSIELDKNEFQHHETIRVALQNKKDLDIEEVQYFIDGKELPQTDTTLTLDIEKLGKKTLVARINYDGKAVKIPRDISVLANEAPSVYTYEVVNEYPHDSGAFTQGLEFYKDTLYESTGRRSTSSIRKVDFFSGEIYQKIDLEEAYFGEGITLLNNKLYQLTWQGGTGFIYNPANLERTGSFKYGESKEGWGLCNDGKRLYKSDGTEKIWMLDPANLSELDYIQIVTNTSMFNKANELEYVDGKIYSNVWQKESMMIIDAKSGAIEGVVNFGGLKDRVTKHPGLDVLNGVAYHPGRKTFFVTGKYWDKLFEVRIVPRD